MAGGARRGAAGGGNTADHAPTYARRHHLSGAALARAAAVARERFGYPSWRPGQAEAIEAVLAGRDTLAVLPTGAGKSAIYQVPALLLDGPTVVVSPLISLQRDQVRNLVGVEGGGAAAANSVSGEAARRRTLESVRAGDLEFVFVSPEQLANAEVLDELAAARPSLLVIDEAHCVSSWGHDFRPDYLRLGAAAEALGRPPVLALTATAAPPVRRDIVDQLRMRDPAVVVRGFDRPAIHLAVRTFHEASTKRDALLDAVVAASGSGLVYASTRANAEDIATALLERGVFAGIYHAGLRAADRKAVQAAWTSGDVQVVVGTTAFGMGIDKPDVRFVYHYDVSDSIDSYYQEIGRAGRDGAASDAVLFFRSQDLGLRRFHAGNGSPRPDVVERVATLVEHAGAVSAADLRSVTGLGPRTLTKVLAALGAVGHSVHGSDDVVRRGPGPAAAAAAVAVTELAERRVAVEQSRVDMMRAYAESEGCRRQVLLTYFGEEAAPCGNCDVCDSGAVAAAADAEVILPWPLHTRVRHGQWGDGQVLRYEEDKVVVLFDGMGYKTLSVSTVLDGDLLRAVSG